MIYLNNAATTQKKPEGVKCPAPKTEAEVRPLIGELLGMKNLDNIIFTQSGTQAVNLALRGFIRRDDHVIVSVTEQDSTLEVLERIGARISYLGIDSYGTLQYEALESMLTPKTTAIVCAHGCSVTGNIADLEKVCSFARKHDLMVISDGCQTIGAAEINLTNLEVDVYCFTGHKKLMGPYGIGGICFKDERIRNQFAAKCIEEIGVIDSNKLGGLYQGVSFILEKGIYGISVWPHRLAKRFFEAVQSLDKVRIYGNFGTNTRLPIVSFAVDGCKAEEVTAYMRKNYDIVVQAGCHGSKQMNQALGVSESGLVRASFGYYNNRVEVNDAVWALMELTEQMDFYLLT